MTLSERKADREVQHDIPEIVFPPLPRAQQNEVLVGYRGLLRGCPPRHRLRTDVVCDGEFEGQRVLLASGLRQPKGRYVFENTVVIPNSCDLHI